MEGCHETAPWLCPADDQWIPKIFHSWDTSRTENGERLSVTVRLIKSRNLQATESVTQTFSNETCQESNSEPFLEARIQHFPRKNPFPVAVPRNKSSGFVQGGYQKESTSYSVHPNHSISWCYKAEHSTTNSWCTILPRRWRITNSVQTYKGPTVLCTWSKKSEKDLYNDRYK